MRDSRAIISAIAAALASVGGSPLIVMPGDDFDRMEREARRYLRKRAGPIEHFETPKPIGKRAKRRARGKAKG